MKLRYFLLTVLAFGASAANVQEQLVQCAKVADNGKRLACFDQLAKTTKAQPQGKALQQDKVIASTADAKANFGMEEKIVAEQQNKVESITAVVVQASQDPYGHLTLVLDNGQHWKQTDSNYSGIHKSDTVILKKGALGAIYMHKKGYNRTIRVVRNK
ncbi:hypothetical protein [Gallaecimonas mangrovi]|uniref:hypothetical protein n=1 Tax=Gallaecimonas mangrovi TaxID=2291597 RepID=UPI000E209B9F|nr:hypothetical protein [Gallaecimonas mangrovi]